MRPIRPPLELQAVSSRITCESRRLTSRSSVYRRPDWRKPGAMHKCGAGQAPVATESVLRQPLLVEVSSKAEAECVAAALGNFGSDLGERRGRWTVAVAQADLDFVTLFAALEDCLHENAIPAVRVGVGNRTYVMEAASD